MSESEKFNENKINRLIPKNNVTCTIDLKLSIQYIINNYNIKTGMHVYILAIHQTKIIQISIYYNYIYILKSATASSIMYFTSFT